MPRFKGHMISALLYWRTLTVADVATVDASATAAWSEAAALMLV